MTKNFNDQARRVLSLAEQQARNLNHEYIGTEHILLALTEDDAGAVSEVLQSFGVERSAIRQEVERLVQRGPNPVATGKLPLTPRASRAIETAADEAKFMNEKSVGPEHLLLGLFREPDGVAGQALRNLGLELGQVVQGVFRTRLEQVKTVERAVRPVRASTTWKRKTREELLAHLTTIYEEEQERLNDSAAAMKESARRFGDPAELSRELDGALPVSERRAYFFERWFGWRAPESAAKYMLRQALQSFCILAAVCVVIAGATLWLAGFQGNIGVALRGPAAFLVLTPLAQFLLGLFYFKLRDAIYGPVWARKSKPKAVLFDALIGLSFFAASLAFVASATWDASRVVDAIYPLAAASVAVAIAHLVLARTRGPREIADAMWALMNIEEPRASEAT